jgi:hypothetical protein
VLDLDRLAWKAAWRAGMCNSLPDVEPEPSLATSGKARMNALYVAGSNALKHPGIVAYVKELEQAAMERFLDSPEAEPIRQGYEEWRQRSLDAEAIERKNLAVILAIAHADFRSVVSWDDDEIHVRCSDELEYHEQLLLTEVTRDETTTADGDFVVTTKVKLADRAKYVAMLEKRFAKTAPQKVEVSGPDGKPLQTETKLNLGPSSEVIDQIARDVLGIVPATQSRQEIGIPLEEIRAIIEAWSADPAPHVTTTVQLFEPEHWEETERRYLVGDGSAED